MFFLDILEEKFLSLRKSSLLLILHVILNALFMGMSIWLADKAINTSHNGDHAVLIEPLLPDQLLVESDASILDISNLGIVNFITETNDVLSFDAMVIKPSCSSSIATL